MDKTMRPAARGGPLSIRENRWIRTISLTRDQAERSEGINKDISVPEHVLVTTVAITHLANFMACFNYLIQFSTIQRRKSAGRTLSRSDWELREFWENRDSSERYAWGWLNWDRDRNVPSYPHRMLNHGEREYADGKGDHINGLEGCWGYLKRRPAASGGIRQEKFCV